MKILEAMSKISPEWLKWVNFIDKNIGNNIVTFNRGIGIADSVIMYCGQDLPKNGVARLDYVCKRFGIQSKRAMEIHNNAEKNPPPFQSIAKLFYRQDDLLRHYQPDAQILLNWYNKRRKNVYAHEVGHFFCAVAWEIASSKGLEGVPKLYEDREKWCWNFAIEFMCPWEVRKEWTKEYINSLEDKFGNIDKNKVLLTLGRIYSIAREHRISVRTVLYALHHLPVLSFIRECIAVLQITHNRYTGVVPSLRIIHTALPKGIFVPKNRRGKNLGFLQSGRIYDSIPNNTYCEEDESILMKIKDPSTGKWSSDFIPFSSHCLYVPVEWEGIRQLVVSWRYELPG